MVSAKTGVVNFGLWFRRAVAVVARVNCRVPAISAAVQLPGEQLADRGEVDETLAQLPLGADLALHERPPSAEDRRESSLQAVLVVAPMAIERLLALDLTADSGWRRVWARL